jgi:hypothetical protein
MPGTISRFERSCRLIAASWAVLRSDSELVILPLISGLATLLLAATFLGFGFLSGIFDPMRDGTPAEHLPTALYVGLFLFYVGQYFLVYFFNTALVSGALERLAGGNPTLGSTLAFAASRAGAIFGYAVISATIGIVLRMIAERLGLIGRLIEAGAGLAWTVATFLAVPVLAAEGVGPIEAIRKSGALLRSTWGENLIGNAGISFAISAIVCVACVLGFGGGFLLADRGQQLAAIPFFFVAIFTVLIGTLLGSALASVYSAVVYRYATGGDLPHGFDKYLVKDSFRRKGA